MVNKFYIYEFNFKYVVFILIYVYYNLFVYILDFELLVYFIRDWIFIYDR